MAVGRELPWPFSPPALGPGPVRVIHVPVLNVCQNQSLSSLKPKRIYVYHRHKQPSKTLAGSSDTEISALLNRVLHITTSIRKTDNLRFSWTRTDEKSWVLRGCL